MTGSRIIRRLAPVARFVRSLARDRAGNTLVMVAVALVPLTAMIGSGLDMSRAYMAQARLQQACDAASLAGRRVMTGDTITQPVRTEVTKFMNFNFPQEMFGTTSFTPTITRPTAGTVRVAASTTLPTSVMKLFGFTSLPIGVTCDAAQTFVNADIVLVLDTTGSMNDELSNGETRIQAMRKAVLALYDTLKPTQDLLRANGYRIRIGIVPYSQTVNVGKLIRGVNSSYIRSPAPSTQVAGVRCANSDCDDLRFWFSRNPATYDGSWFSNWAGCIEERQTVATAGSTPTTAELETMYDLNIDLIPDSRPETKWEPYDRGSNVVLNNALAACPSEAHRLREWLTKSDLETQINALAPRGATYHDVGMIWGARFISAGGIFGDGQPNFNGMRTNRFVIFLSDGEMAAEPLVYSAYGTEWAENRISGKPFQSTKLLSDRLYSDLNARHTARFNIMCNRVRDMQVSVYVIAFATTLSDSMTNCATGGSAQARTAANSSQLIAQFEQIGREITELRVAQ